MTDQTPSAADVLMFAAQMHGVDAELLAALLVQQTRAAHHAQINPDNYEARAFAELGIVSDPGMPEEQMIAIFRALWALKDSRAFVRLIEWVYEPSLLHAVAMRPLLACDFDEMRRQVEALGLAGVADPEPESDRGLVDDSAVPYTLLLVPADGDPLGLVAPGVCGARPPRVTRWVCCTTQHVKWSPTLPTPGCLCNFKGTWQLGSARALPVIWGGKPVEEGIDRAGRYFERYLGYGPWHRSYPATRATAVNLAHNLCDPDHANAATMVRLDAQGQEMAPPDPVGRALRCLEFLHDWSVTWNGTGTLGLPPTVAVTVTPWVEFTSWEREKIAIAIHSGLPAGVNTVGAERVRFVVADGRPAMVHFTINPRADR